MGHRLCVHHVPCVCMLLIIIAGFIVASLVLAILSTHIPATVSSAITLQMLLWYMGMVHKGRLNPVGRREWSLVPSNWMCGMYHVNHS
jgi:hypothetical protein